MESKYPFLRLFKNCKPIIGMIHLKGYTNKEVSERAIKEINIMNDAGVDAIMVENYFGNAIQVEHILYHISKHMDKIIYGHNIQWDNIENFELARNYGSKFIKVDSVSGHLPPEKDKKFEEFFLRERESCDAYILGGVRFKNQPQYSGRTLEEDLKIGMSRCDAICVSSVETGIETDIEKIQSFRKHIGDFPLIVSSGMTAKNCASQLQIADGAIIGSYFKDTYKNDGDVCQKHVVEFMNVVSDLRKSLPQKDL